MSEPAQNSDQHVAAISKERLLVLAALAGLGIAIVYFYMKSNSAASNLNRQNVELRKDLANANTVLAELKQAELRRLEEETVNATVVDERLSDLDRAEVQLQELTQELKKWRSTEADLNQGDLGPRVASNEDALRQYQTLQSLPKPDALLPEKLQARLNLLRKPLLKAAASDLRSYRPGPQFEHILLQIQQDITDSLVNVRMCNTQLSGIIAQAPSNATPDALPLADALKHLENAWAIAQTEKMAEAVRKVREEFDAKLATEKAETERIRRQIELDRQKHKSEMEALSRRNENQQLADNLKRVRDEQEQKAARRTLERLFQHDLPEMKSLLKPFITDGRTQPGKYSFETTVDVGPVSFAKLQGAGALIRTVEAQRKFWSMTTANRTNDRDLGGFPAYVGSAQDWKNKQPTVGRAQELLIKYGPLMVEKGMLAP